METGPLKSYPEDKQGCGSNSGPLGTKMYFQHMTTIYQTTNYNTDWTTYNAQTGHKTMQQNNAK